MDSDVVKNRQKVQKPEGSRAKAPGGEAVLPILRTSGKAGYGALWIPMLLRIDKRCRSRRAPEPRRPEVKPYYQYCEPPATRDMEPQRYENAASWMWINPTVEMRGPEGSRAKATGGEAVLPILRTSGNAGYGVLRHPEMDKPEGSIAKATGGEAVLPILRTSGNAGYGVLRLIHPIGWRLRGST